MKIDNARAAKAAKTNAPGRVRVISPKERRALRDTGRTVATRNLARECDMAFGRYQTLREVELRMKAEADAAWNRATALMDRLIAAVEREAAKGGRNGVKI